jgi:carboxyl-terminal processing protease
MRGPVGEKIVIGVSREGIKPFKLTIKRAVIKIRSVRYEAIENIGYVRITTFNAQTTLGLKKALNDLKEKLGEEQVGLILDLRNNPGGLLNQAITVSDIFLDYGEIVSTRGRDPEKASRIYAKPGDLSAGLPVIVLINTGSASASEIVAGALQDHKRALILGTQSFGKGSVQTIVPLTGKVAMRLTTSRYYTPSGRSIQKTGITPDIIVEAAKIEKNKTTARRRETDLRGALENKDKDEKKTSSTTKGRPSAKVMAKTDYQLARAVDLLKGLAVLKTRLVN